MEQSYPLALALYDFVPVIFFLIGAIFLVRIAARLCGLRCRPLAIMGSGLIFLGGFLKALWKFIFTIGLGDFQWMSESQFILVAPGFVVLLIVVIRMARSERMEASRMNNFILAIAVWKIPLLAIMTLASMGVMGLLTYIGFRLKVKLAAAGYIVAFLCLVGLGAMASGEQTVARQWVEQSVNTMGQFGFMVGGYFLFRKVVD